MLMETGGQLFEISERVTWSGNVFCKPLLSSKIHRGSKLLRCRGLIIMLLIIGCVEAHPGLPMSFNVGKFSYIFLHELEISQ